MEITDLTAVELRNHIQAKQLSPVEVMNAYLARIESEDKKWNAYVTLNERALEEAKKAEAIIMKNEKVGLLHGMPIAIKDLTPTKGILTTYGSPVFKDYIPNHEPTFLKRVKAAGAIVLGKTNTPEFGHKGLTDNPLFGTTKNPWNEKLTPGGSSGGSAVAVAAKLAPFAEGSDGGGSIRIPAALTGIFGLKPTFGVVPHDNNPNNVFGSQHPYLHNGPMTRTVDDASLLFSVMKGYSEHDPDTAPLMEQERLKALSEVKVAYIRDFGLYEVSQDVQTVIDRAVNRFSDLGCHVKEIDIDLGMTLLDLQKTFSKLWCVRYAADYGEYLDKQPENFSETLTNMIQFGRKLSAVDYKALDEERTRLWHAIQQVFQTYDFIISPTLATTAFDHQIEGPTEINGKSVRPNDWMMTQIYNLTGHPAVSLPVGLTETGLPVGLQIASRKFTDEMLLELCRDYEQAFATYIDPEK